MNLAVIAEGIHEYIDGDQLKTASFVTWSAPYTNSRNPFF